MTITQQAPKDSPEDAPHNADDSDWTRGGFFWLAWALAPLLIFALAWLTLGVHDAPLSGSQKRF